MSGTIICITLTSSLQGLVEQIAPQIKPVFDGVEASRKEIGQAIPLIGDLNQLLRQLCIA